jgi:hypothetical protein
MSFIFEDSDLIDQLVAHGLDFAVKFTKRGQVAANAVDQDRAALLAQIKNLQDQINPAGASKDPNAGPTISHEGDAALGSPQLESLGDLIKWLAGNKTMLDGKRIAFDTNPNSDEYTPYKLETHTTTPQQRGQDLGMFYVNPDLLKKYLVSLQAYEQQNPNTAMQVQLRARIQDANQELGLGVNPQYEAPEKVLPDTTVLDNLPHVINVKYPTQGGNIPLTYGDLKDDTSFNAWLSKNNIALDAGDEGGPVLINNPRFDFKKIIDAIIQRAQFFMTRATDAQSKERYNIYLRQSSTLGSQIGSGGTPANKSQVGSTNQQGGQGSQQGGSASQALQDAVQVLPFASRDINFDRIRTFFDAIKRLMGSDARVTRIINDTMQLMTSVNSRMSIGDIFPMGVRPSDFAARFKNQQTPGADYYGILKDLSQIINNTRMVVEYFWYKYAQNLTGQKTYLMGQIGETPQDDSLYNQNAESLQDLYSAKHT